MKILNCRCVGIFLLAPLFACAATPAKSVNAGNLPLTVLMDFENPHSKVSLDALRRSLNQILVPTGISADVQLKDDQPDHPQYGSLVIFKMKGSCQLTSIPVGALSDERGPLAMAYTSDGEVLHFGEVQCDRVRRSLQRVLGHNFSIKSEQSYGSALAVVMAHEVYHMLGNAKRHTRTGLTKAELSAADLLNSKLALSQDAMTTVRSYR